MSIYQRFKVEGSDAEICEFLHGLDHVAQVNHRGNSFRFLAKDVPDFVFDCEVKPGAIVNKRSGEYSEFFSTFIEALVGRFGQVEMEDASAIMSKPSSAR